MNHNEVYEHALTYIEFCGGDVSTNSFKIWASLNFNEVDKNRIFLCAISLVQS